MAKLLKSSILAGIAFGVMANFANAEITTKNLLTSGVSHNIGLWPDNTYGESGMVTKYLIHDVDENNNSVPLDLSTKNLYIVTDIALGNIIIKNDTSNATVKCGIYVSPYDENYKWFMSFGFDLDMKNEIIFEDDTKNVVSNIRYQPNKNYRVAWTISNSQITAIIKEQNNDGSFRKIDKQVSNAKVNPKYISVKRTCSWKTDNPVKEFDVNLKLNLISAKVY